MRKWYVLLLVLLLLCPASVFGEAAEPATILEFEDLIATISTYCTAMNSRIGRSMNEDLLFDPENYAPVPDARENGEGPFRLLDFDGVILKVDDQLNIYAIAVNVTDQGHSALWTNSRVCAVVSTLAENFPKQMSDITNRYLNIVNSFLDAFQTGWRDAVEGKETVWTYYGMKDAVRFYFVASEMGDIYLSTTGQLF